MLHSCLGLNKYVGGEMKGFKKYPHSLSPSLKDSPDRDAMIVTVVYMNDKEHISWGWGIRLTYCPACGEKIGEITGESK